MSELLQNWLNNDVGLSTNVNNFENDFASGYLFGEILHKFKQQDDFHEFFNRGSYEAKMANFKRLEPTLKALGIKFNAAQSKAMMNGERGAALKLLYQLKMATEKLLLASNGKGAQAAGEASTAPLLNGNNITRSIRVPRKEFDAHEQRFFDRQLHATCRNGKQDRMDRVTTRFRDERAKQEAVTLELGLRGQAQIEQQRHDHRIGLLNQFHDILDAKAVSNAKDLKHWKQNMRSKAAREKRDVDFQSTLSKKQQDKCSKTKDIASSEVRDGIEAFERSLAGLGFGTRTLGGADGEALERAAAGASSDSDGGGSSPDGETLVFSATQAATARDLTDALQARVPNAQELEQEAGLFLRKIKESKHAGSVARKERERRRRRVLVEQQREQEQVEESKLEEVLLEKLSQESIEERAISYSVWKTQKYEDVIIKNRHMRQQSYDERKKKDHKAAVERDKALLEEMVETMREQEEREQVRYRATERNRQAGERAKLLDECDNILQLISSMAFSGLHQEQLTDRREVDATMWGEWMSLFVESVAVTTPDTSTASASTIYPLTAVPPQADPGDVSEAILNDAALHEYMEARGQWEVDGANIDSPDSALPVPDVPGGSRSTSPLGDATRVVDLVDGRPVNYRLGVVVAAILDRCYREAPASTPPPMPDVPLRLVVTGKPFSGKKTLAARLAEAYKLQVIDLEELIQECFVLSKRSDLPTTQILNKNDDQNHSSAEAGNKYLQQLRQLGLELQQRLDNGEAVSNELYVQLITTKIRHWGSLLPDRSPSIGSNSIPAVAAVAAEDSNAATPGEPPVAEDQSGDNADRPAAEKEASLTDAEAAATEKNDIDSKAAQGKAQEESSLNPTVGTEGWILIGFPDDKERLGLLERALSGWVWPGARPTPEAEKQKTAAAILAPQPHEEPPPFVLMPGGYDLHFRLQVAGNEAVRRAVGRRLDPTMGQTYHLEDNPPVSEHELIFERLVPIDALSESMGTLSQRMHQFDIAQSGVDELLAYFGPTPEYHRRVDVDVNKEYEQVYEELNREVAMLLQRKKTKRDAEAASAEAAKVAKETAAAEAAAAQEAADAEVMKMQDGNDAGDPSRAVSPSSPAGPQEPEPGLHIHLLREHVQKLETGVFDLLVHEWEELQGAYVDSLCQLFRWHRSYLGHFRTGLNGIQQQFIAFLKRPDNKQALVDTFIQQFNDFSLEWADMRKQDLTKDEFHQRADDLQEQLNELVESNRTENLARLETVEKSHWVDNQFEVLASQVQLVSRLEVRRYHTACHLLSDFYHSALGTALPTARPPPAKIDMLDAESMEQPVVAAVDSKVKKDKSEKSDKGAKKEEAQRNTIKEGKEDLGPVHLRRYVEATSETEERPVGTGHWEFPFLDHLLAQARAAVWSLSDDQAPAEKEPEQKGKAAKGRNSPPPKDPRVSPDVEAGLGGVAERQQTPWLHNDLEQALFAEQQTFFHRLNVVRSWAHKRLLAASEASTALFAELHDWIVLRHHRELQAVEKLVDIIKEHVESEELILANLTLEGAHLHRHPNVLLRPPKPPTVSLPLEGVAPWRWTIDQLDRLLGLVVTAASACSTGTTLPALPTRSLSRLLERIAQQPLDGACGASAVPRAWQLPDSANRLQRLCKLFERPPCAGRIDCVEFLLHVALLNGPLGWPSLEALMQVRAELEPQVPRGSAWPDFWISASQLEQLPLFVDPFDAEADFAEDHVRSTGRPPADFNRSKEQMRWLGRVLQAFPVPVRQLQAWQLEAAWHDYHGRCREDEDWMNEQLNDMKPTGDSDDETSQADAMVPLLPPSEPLLAPPASSSVTVGGRSSEETRQHMPPRPERPENMPEPPFPGALSVRQMLTYLCLGDSVTDGIRRALRVLGPVAGENAAISAVDLHAVFLQLGARCLAPCPDGDGRPLDLSLDQLRQQLGLEPRGPISASSSVTGAAASSRSQRTPQLRAADLPSSERVQRVLASSGLSSRHCRVDLAALFPPASDNYHNDALQAGQNTTGEARAAITTATVA